MNAACPFCDSSGAVLANQLAWACFDNVGAASGQTIAHLHVHLIPRYVGDCADPRGGVRGVIPGKQWYPIEGEAT